MGTKLLGFSIGRGSGALKGLTQIVGIFHFFCLFFHVYLDHGIDDRVALLIFLKIEIWFWVRYTNPTIPTIVLSSQPRTLQGRSNDGCSTSTIILVACIHTCMYLCIYKGSAWVPAFDGTHASDRAGQHFGLFDSILGRVKTSPHTIIVCAYSM